jgi:DNA-binding transcriptional LysR family regulator
LIERYPKVEVEVQAENLFVNIVAEGFDAGIRLSEAIERDMVQVRRKARVDDEVRSAPETHDDARAADHGARAGGELAGIALA